MALVMVRHPLTLLVVPDTANTNPPRPTILASSLLRNRQKGQLAQSVRKITQRRSYTSQRQGRKEALKGSKSEKMNEKVNKNS